MISVVIPLYNVSSFIKGCLDSVKAIKSFKEKFEVILVDDGSSDDSYSVAQSQIKGFGNCRLIKQENKGLGGARNTGMSYASGRYVVFLDADDKFLADSFESLLNLISREDFDIIEFGAQGIESKGKVVYQCCHKRDTPTCDGIQFGLKYQIMNSACNKLYNLAFLKRNNFKFKEHIYIEDFEFNFRVFINAEKVKGIKLIASLFLQSPNSITRNNNPSRLKKMRNDIIFVMQIIKDEYIAISVKVQKSGLEKYYEDKLTFLNITLFNKLKQSNFSYLELQKVKKNLISKGVFKTNIEQKDFKRELFRRVFMRNFFLLRF